MGRGAEWNQVVSEWAGEEGERTSLQPLPTHTLLSRSPLLQFYSTLEGKLPMYNTRIALPVAGRNDRFFGQYGQGKGAGPGAQAEHREVVRGRT